MRNRPINRFKLFDIYPKTHEDIQERSFSGAIVTLLSIICVSLFLLSEIYDYANVDKTSSLTVHVDRGEKMQFKVKMIFQSLPCEVINLDVTDRTGEDQIATPNIVKSPWSGKVDDLQSKLQPRRTFGFNSRLRIEDNVWDEANRISSIFRKKKKEKPCGPCYQAKRFEGQCCNNCYELRIAFAESGLDVKLADKHEQCIVENSEGPEGCLLSGSIDVNMVPGNFHIAAGTAHSDGEAAGHHHHWAYKQRAVGFNTTHYITSLSFGAPIAGIRNPLDGTWFIENGVGQQQYFIQVVPTEFHKSNGEIVKTNQYSYTSHHTVIDVNQEHIGLPGVFFKFDISPLKILIKENNIPFSHFLMRLCAVIGGVWVVLGLLHSTFKNIVEFFVKLLTKQ